MSPHICTTATSSHTDITDRFDLDTKEITFMIYRIKLKPDALKPTGELLVNFDFFSQVPVITLMLIHIQCCRLWRYS